MTGAVRVSALYRFVAIAEPAALRDALRAVAAAGGVRGTMLIAPEGVNGTIAGTPAALDAVIAQVRALPGEGKLSLKHDHVARMPFHRLKVRVKQEIVTMGEAVDARGGAGTHVAPADWNALIDDPATLVIDTRNDYEVAVGSFTGAVDPATPSFRDFPAWFRANRDTLLAGKTRVAMFCTGGIRCEKSTALLRQEGIADVFHLDGGILRYLEEMPAAKSRWHGECFVFDERVAVGHGLAPGSHTLCRACRMPLSAADRAASSYVEGVSCPACHARRSEAQRAGYAERHRQETLAATRGEAHVGRNFQEE